MRKLSVIGLSAAVVPLCVVGCSGGGSGYPPLFEPKPECEGAAITPYQGMPRIVISSLEIGDLEDGFDLDGERDPDGPNKPDNKLSAEQTAREKARLASIKDKLTVADKQRIVTQAQQLQERQNSQPDVSILPKVELSDVPADIKWPEGRWFGDAVLPVS